MTIAIPANAKMTYNLMVDLANLKLFDTSIVEEAVFGVITEPQKEAGY